MDKKCKNVGKTTFVFIVGLFIHSALYAQENGPALVELMTRVGAIEDENRELRGQLEEARHELSQLNKRVETLSADIDYRLNNPESGASLAPLPISPSTALASGKESKTSPSSASTATDEYEKARTLLEQGEYEAAEHAFSTFMGAHPKDELAGASQYWLGVTYFVRGQHEKAAAAFAKGYKNYPKSSKAADNLLKLSKSLAALDRKADACTTLDQLSSEHPKAHAKEVSSERKKLKCK